MQIQIHPGRVGAIGVLALALLAFMYTVYNALTFGVTMWPVLAVFGGMGLCFLAWGAVLLHLSLRDEHSYYTYTVIAA